MNKTLKQEISDELQGLAEDVNQYFAAGIPLANHQHDIQLKIAASTQVILQMFPNEPKSETQPVQIKGCPDALLPDGPFCPRCGGHRAPSGVDGGSWVHLPELAGVLPPAQNGN